MTGRRPLRRVAAALGAVTAPVLVWGVAVLLLGHQLTVSQRRRPPLTIGVGTVVVLALVAGLAGWGLLALLERLTRHAHAVWTITALVVLAGSFVLLTGAMTAETRTELALMHVGVAAVLIPGLLSGRPSRVRGTDRS